MYELVQRAVHYREVESPSAELIIAKQRNGPLGEVKLIFHKAYARFDSSAQPHYHEAYTNGAA
jgi:replicative DNA helicase